MTSQNSRPCSFLRHAPRASSLIRPNASTSREPSHLASFFCRATRKRSPSTACRRARPGRSPQAAAGKAAGKTAGRAARPAACAGSLRPGRRPRSRRDRRTPARAACRRAFPRTCRAAVRTEQLEPGDQRAVAPAVDVIDPARRQPLLQQVKVLAQPGQVQDPHVLVAFPQQPVDGVRFRAAPAAAPRGASRLSAASRLSGAVAPIGPRRAQARRVPWASAVAAARAVSRPRGGAPRCRRSRRNRARGTSARGWQAA